MYEERQNKVLILGLTGVFSLVGLGLVGVMANSIECSKGERTGKVIEFSEKGAVFKTYEGKMLLDDPKTDGALRVLRFSLDDFVCEKKLSELSTELKQARDSEALVTLTYSKNLWTWPCRAETNYLVEKIEFMDK